MFQNAQIGIGITYILPTMFFAFMFHFMFQLIDYQYFQRLKHTTFMFHF